MIVPWIIVVIIFNGFVMYFITKAYLSTVQKLKAFREILSNISARSPCFFPCYGKFFGIITIRSAKVENMTRDMFDYLQDQHSSTWYLFLICSQTFGYYLDILVTVFLAILTFQFLAFKDGSTLSGSVSLAITQASVLNGMVQAGIRFNTEVISNMVSVERILQYVNIDKEDDDNPSKPDLPKNWPGSGKIEFQNTALKYAPEESLVLKDFEYHRISRRKRTGAGKSSLIAAIFRLAPIEGKIIVDGVDISLLELKLLRSKISIIPQEPVLFSTSVRENLDPLQENDDEILWRVLEKNRYFNTEKRFCTHFKDCTVLTIAHRLNSVVDADNVLVMDHGRVVEYGHPHELLQQPDGYFVKMINESGVAEEEHLKIIANENFRKKSRK
ncbi:hypothetical protein NQ317_003762 [Molorchus minor]|uniref:ABC transporter domain-containing protein n=1 Tax=Molorchus minor TaxID=1323400 RepID=A0ABQ9JS43_9CUCU|nr:hypothetical protein NQ317_003762 [Molorchus minor]